MVFHYVEIWFWSDLLRGVNRGKVSPPEKGLFGITVVFLKIETTSFEKILSWMVFYHVEVLSASHIRKNPYNAMFASVGSDWKYLKMYISIYRQTFFDALHVISNL